MLFSIFLQSGGSINGVITSLISSRNAWHTKTDIGLLENFIWMGYYATSLFYIKKINSGFKKIDLIIVPLVGLATATIALDGTRHHALYVAIPILLFLVNLGSRKNKKYFLVAGALLFSFGILYQAQSISRYSGWSNISTVSTDEITKFGGADQYQALNYAIDIVPSRHEYFTTPVSPFFILHWIPSSIWHDKIYEPTAIYLSSEWTGGIPFTELNITPSIIGQYHMNFGVLGVIWIGFFMGIMFKMVDFQFQAMTIFRQNNAWALLGLVLAFFIASFRHFSPLYFIFVALGYILFMLGTKPNNQKKDA
jgi:FtsH-binding integral membrane protein